MKLVVEESLLREALRRRHPHQAAADARPAEPDVVEQHEQHVGRPFGRLLHWREVRCRVGCVHPNLCVGKLPLGLGQVIAVEMNRELWGLALTHDALLADESWKFRVRSSRHHRLDMLSVCIRSRSVLGFSLSSAAAPPSPSISPPVNARVCMSVDVPPTPESPALWTVLSLWPVEDRLSRRTLLPGYGMPSA